MRRASLHTGLAGGLVFLLALALRLLFWRATPDAAWPSSAAYQGDAFTWLDYARALAAGREFETGLPWRPPGMAWLVAWLGGGEGDLGFLKLVWCLLGAATVYLVYRAVRRDFGEAPAWVAGILCAASTGLLILSTSLNNETPWLLLALLAVSWVEPLRRRRGAGLAAAWGAVNAAACLIRPEHLIFFAFGAAWIALGREGGRLAASLGRGGRTPSAETVSHAPARRGAGRSGRGVERRDPTPGRGESRRPRPWPALALALVAFVVVLAPWHLKAWSRVARFNDAPQTLAPAAEARQAALEAILAPVAWEPEAEAALEELPVFTRRSAGLFVAATVAHRGGTRVRAEDLRLLDEAFGARPSPLPERFFVALYGGLNFYLANNAAAVPGFTRGPLDAPPRLAGGASRYPAALITGVPPAELALIYPPHNEAVAHGWRLGWRWIAEHPGAALAGAGRKLRGFWSGAALGWTGYNLPAGLSGLRRRVDLVVPEGAWGAGVWPLLVLAGCAAGLAWGWRGDSHGSPQSSFVPLVPWLLFLSSRAATAVVYFGYARVGATVIPVVSLLLALAAVAAWRRLRARRAGAAARTRPRPLVAAALAALALLTVETARWASRPELRLDGRRAGAVDPTRDDYRDLHLEIRSSE